MGIDYAVFADESGMDGDSPCYTIGMVAVALSKLDAFNSYFEQIKIEQRVRAEELKWGAFRKRANVLNMGQHLLSAVLRSETASYSCIVVHRNEFAKWGEDPVDAFYTTYTLLLQNFAQRVPGNYHVSYDRRRERYKKHNEVMQIVGNRMLQLEGSISSFSSVEQGDSKAHYGIQAADLFTGAVNTARAAFLQGAQVDMPAKRLFIAHASRMLGLSGLHVDTMPSPKFNIWHFPREVRGKPGSEQVRLRPEVLPISNQDLRES